MIPNCKKEKKCARRNIYKIDFTTINPITTEQGSALYFDTDSSGNFIITDYLNPTNTDIPIRSQVKGMGMFNTSGNKDYGIYKFDVYLKFANYTSTQEVTVGYYSAASGTSCYLGKVHLVNGIDSINFNFNFLANGRDILNIFATTNNGEVNIDNGYMLVEKLS